MFAVIYKINCYQACQIDGEGERYSLDPWGKNTIDYKGEDDGGKEYILPDGYEIGKGQDEQNHVYDASGECCDLITYNNRPAIVDIKNEYPLILKLRSKIAEYRINLNLSQKELADSLGTHQVQVARWESGERNPKTDTLLKMAKIFNCSIEDLI